MSATAATNPWAEGWRPWTTFLLGCLFFCYGFFQRVAPSVMVEDLMRDFAVGAAILGNLSAFYFYSYSVLQFPIGLWLDRYGPRFLLSGATALCALGSLVFAWADDLNLAYLGRFLVGAGAAFTWVGVMTLVTSLFPLNRFAFLIGIAQFFGMSGGVFGQAPLAMAVSAFGWRTTMAAAALVAAALAAAMVIIIRNRGDGRRDVVAPSAARRPPMRAILAHIMTNPQSWVAALQGCALVGPVLAFGGLWGVPYLMQSYGIDRPAAAGAVSLLFVGFGVGAPFLGWYSDHIGRRRLPLLISAGLTLFTLAIFLYGPGLPLAMACVLFILQGVGAGGMVISLAAARELNPPNATGAVFGMVNTAVVAGAALFQPLIGLLLDLNWDGAVMAGVRHYSLDNFHLALSILPILSGLGVLAALSTRETHCRQQAAPL